MNCPLCVDESLQPTYRGGIEIDVCPRCRGIWLDRGELERLAAPEETPPAARPTYSRPQPADFGRGAPVQPATAKTTKNEKKKRKPKSFAERLGDVLEDVLDL